MTGNAESHLFYLTRSRTPQNLGEKQLQRAQQETWTHQKGLTRRGDSAEMEAKAESEGAEMRHMEIKKSI